MADETLLTLLDDVRGKTLTVLENLDETHARWAPPGLQNSCLWHAGHAYVVTEFLTMRPIGQEPKVPEGWFKMFSWESNPAHIDPKSWPPLEEVVAALKAQHERLRGVIAGLTAEQLDATDPSNASHDGPLQHRARHPGRGRGTAARSRCLRKLMTRTFVVQIPAELLSAAPPRRPAVAGPGRASPLRSRRPRRTGAPTMRMPTPPPAARSGPALALGLALTLTGLARPGRRRRPGRSTSRRDPADPLGHLLRLPRPGREDAEGRPPARPQGRRLRRPRRLRGDRPRRPRGERAVLPDQHRRRVRPHAPGRVAQGR